MADYKTPDRFRWAPRVSRRKIWRLYESGAPGMLDQDLLDDIGYGIYIRCLDMIGLAAAIRKHEVTCRNCGTKMMRHGWQHVDGVRRDPSLGEVSR